MVASMYRVEKGFKAPIPGVLNLHNESLIWGFITRVLEGIVSVSELGVEYGEIKCRFVVRRGEYF